MAKTKDNKFMRKFILKLGRTARLHDAGYTPEEIAETIGMPVATVKRWLDEYIPPKDKRDTITASMRTILG